MAICNGISVPSDKLVAAVGQKTATSLIGEKYIASKDVTANKNVALLGDSFVTNFYVTTNKSNDLLGLKYINGLSGLKYISNLIGSSEKSISLNADGACPGWWYILISDTRTTIDNTYITIDRTPNI